MELNRSYLEMVLLSDRYAMTPGPLQWSHWDIITGATIRAFQPTPEYHWSASLYYAKIPPTSEYRWYEISFFTLSIGGNVSKFAPFALTDLERVDQAASPASSTLAVAFGPMPIDDENAKAFVDRWSDLLAKAVHGELAYPRSLPLGGYS